MSVGWFAWWDASSTGAKTCMYAEADWRLCEPLAVVPDGGAVQFDWRGIWQRAGMTLEPSPFPLSAAAANRPADG